MSKLSTPSPTNPPQWGELLGAAVEEMTGLTKPTLDELHTYAASHGRKVSELLGEAERLAADRDLGRRHLDREIRALRTVQDVGRFAEAKSLDLIAVFSRRIRTEQQPAI